MNPSEEDSVIGDVRRARARVLAECGNDLGKLADKLIAQQRKHPERVVNLRQRKPGTPDSTSG